MIVNRYMNGAEISENELRAVKLKNPKIAEIIGRAEARMRANNPINGARGDEGGNYPGDMVK